MMSYKSDLVDIEVTVRRETDKAYGVVDPNAGALIWLPKSQCAIGGVTQPSCKGLLTAPEWLLIEKGLI